MAAPDSPAQVLRVLAAPASMPVDGNPYISLLYGAVRSDGVVVDDFSRKRLLERYDVVHVQWPELLVRWTDLRTATLDVVKVLGGLWLARRRGARLVWTGHNLGAHDMRHPRLYRLYMTGFLRLVDSLISLSDSATDSLRRAYPALISKPTATVPHGHYRDVYDEPIAQAQARERMGLGDVTVPTVLLLGQVRRYKNIPALVRSFARDMADSTHLVIAGAVKDAALKDEIADAAGGSSAVTTRLELVASSDVSVWHSAADIVVLPYSQATSLNSGAALLALSLNRPVVVPDSGPMRELQAAVGAEWVHLFSGGVEDALAVAETALAESRDGRPDLSAFEWSRLGAATVAAYRQTVRAR